MTDVDTGTKRGDRFLAAFRSIEHSLRDAQSIGREIPFTEVVRRARRANGVVNRYADDLAEFAELRNAISHRRNDRLLAEPTEEATTQLEQLREVLSDPPRLDSVVGTRKVLTCEPDQSVRSAASLMTRGDFSQVPIYRGSEFIGLLTAETVTRWVSAELDDNDGMLEDATISVALQHAEDTENNAFLPRSGTVFDVMDLFDSFNARGKSLDAILVTQDGRATVPLNILTVYDIPAMLRALPGRGGRLLG